jgi:hypothetical protein
MVSPCAGKLGKSQTSAAYCNNIITIIFYNCTYIATYHHLALTSTLESITQDRHAFLNQFQNLNPASSSGKDSPVMFWGSMLATKLANDFVNSCQDSLLLGCIKEGFSKATFSSIHLIKTSCKQQYQALRPVLQWNF